MSSKTSGGTPKEMIRNAQKILFRFPIKKESCKVERILNIVEKETKDYDFDSKKGILIISIKNINAALKIYEATFESKDFKNKPEIQCITS